MNVSKRVLIKFKVLVDTKPLYTIITFQIGLKKDVLYVGDLLRQLERMGVPLASAWPVFVYRDFKKRGETLISSWKRLRTSL